MNNKFNQNYFRLTSIAPCWENRQERWHRQRLLQNILQFTFAYTFFLCFQWPVFLPLSYCILSSQRCIKYTLAGKSLTHCRWKEKRCHHSSEERKYMPALFHRFQLKRGLHQESSAKEQLYYFWNQSQFTLPLTRRELRPSLSKI